MRRPTRFALAAAAALTTAAAVAASPAFGSPARSASTAVATTSGNLIVDPGGEAAVCSMKGLDGMTVPGWTITKGEPNVVCYTAGNGFPSSSTPGSPTRGNGFFDGGGTGDSALSQTIDVSAAASTIDGGGTSFDLNGWLGGWSSQNAYTTVTATFLNASGSAIGSAAQIGPVTASDRGSTTEFLHKDTTGTLPAGTRSVRVDMTFTWGSGSNYNDGYADDLSFSIGASVPAPALTAPASAVPGFDHVFLVYMENQDYSGIIGNASQAPYINSLLPKGTSLTQSYATTHPSDPNYMAVGGGQLNGLYDNSVSTTTIDAKHLGNSVDAAGKTWKSYVENESGPCDYTSHGYYAPDDVPFTYFKQFKSDQSSTGYCAQHDVPLPQMTTDLASTSTSPNFVWFEPDDCDDMESCGITAGDTWLKNTLPTIFNSPAWTQQKSLLILTWDEGSVKSFGPGYPNQTPTILLGSQNTVKVGYNSSQRTDQYGLLRVIDKALGLAPLTNNDGYAATVNDAWTSGVPANDFSVSASPASGSVAAGSTANSTISTAVTSGSAQTVSLSASGLPSGATASFSPASVTAGGSSTLTVQTSASTPAGTYAVTVTGSAASGTHSTTFNLTVTGSGGITNGGFETGTFSGWTTAGTTSIVNSGAHSGTYAAQLGGTSPTNGDSSAAQTFTAPTGSSKLSFYYNVTCPDTLTYDWATATLKDNTTGSTSTVLAPTCVSSSGWTQVTASVTAGHSYTLTLTSHDDDYYADPTYTLYDDVTLS